MNFKVSVIKKSEILASMVVLMLVVAGYLNYTYDPTKNYDVEIAQVMGNNLGDALLVDSSSISTNIDELEEMVVASSKAITSEEYFSATRMERKDAFAKQIEIYEKILENNNLEKEEKELALNEILRINSLQNAITICENLIKLKGYKDAVIMINESNVNAIIYAESLNNDQIKTIENIIKNELKINIENLHITSL